MHHVCARDHVPVFDSLHSELGSNVAKVMAARVQLQQVSMNLMPNGIEAMKEIGIGDLTIESQQHGNRQLLISIGDTGRGGRAGQAAQVFNAFFSTKPQGTGMGLPISKSMVESHGDGLWATSKSGPRGPFQFTFAQRSTVNTAG